MQIMKTEQLCKLKTLINHFVGFVKREESKLVKIPIQVGSQNMKTK